MTLEKLRETWEQLGTVDPYWAVLSDSRYRGTDCDIDGFMATGTEQAARVAVLLERSRLPFGRKILDFGCGVGRLTNALARESRSETVGIDIADSMIQRARVLNRQPDLVSFVHYEGGRLPFADDSFDNAVTLVVLQHMQPAAAIAAVLELLRVVRPGGALVMQVPSHSRAEAPMPDEAYRADLQIVDAPRHIEPGEFATVTARVRNDSRYPWPKNRNIRLGNHWVPPTGPSVVNDGRTTLPADLHPGESVELSLHVQSPAAIGDWQLELDLVHENVTWWAAMDSGVTSLPVEVRDGATKTTPAAHAAPDVPNEPGEGPNQGIEMHGLHSDLVGLLLAHCGAEIVEAVEDREARAEWFSYTYVVKVNT